MPLWLSANLSSGSITLRQKPIPSKIHQNKTDFSIFPKFYIMVWLREDRFLARFLDCSPRPGIVRLGQGILLPESFVRKPCLKSVSVKDRLRNVDYRPVVKWRVRINAASRLHSRGKRKTGVKRSLRSHVQVPSRSHEGSHMILLLPSEFRAKFWADSACLFGSDWLSRNKRKWWMCWRIWDSCSLSNGKRMWGAKG